MLIYAGTKSDFMIDTENDRLETKLYENIKLKMNRTTGLSELNAWRNSLKKMQRNIRSCSLLIIKGMNCKKLALLFWNGDILLII
jgi:hypothetical protein